MNKFDATTVLCHSCRDDAAVVLPNENEKPASVKRGLMTIIDLAGSERVSKSGSEGLRLEEAKKINKSICALGNVIASLAEKNGSYVSFRDSKLTRLLTHSLSGNCLTSICATLNPLSIHFDESFSTALFASRAMAVNIKATVNESEKFLVPQRGFDENTLLDASGDFLGSFAKNVKGGKGKRKGLGKTNGKENVDDKGGKGGRYGVKGLKGRNIPEGNSYSLIYCFQKALHKAQSEVEILKADMENKDKVLQEAESQANELAKESGASSEAQRQAEDAVIQLTQALLASRQAMAAKENLCEARIAEMAAHIDAREAEMQAQVRGLEEEVTFLRQKLKEKEFHDEYRILI